MLLTIFIMSLLAALLINWVRKQVGIINDLTQRAEALDQAANRPDTARCPGCHAGDFSDFDHYCDVNGIAMDDTPHAFADWLRLTTGWDGTYGPIEQGA